MYKTCSPLKRLTATLLDIISFALIVVIILSVAALVMYLTGQAVRIEDIDYFLSNYENYLPYGVGLEQLGIFGFLSEPFNIPLFDFGYVALFPSMVIKAVALGAIAFTYLMYFIIVPAVGSNQTIGRLITGTKVVTLDGEKPGIGKVFVREIIGNQILTAAAIGVVFNLFFIFSDSNKTLSDTLAKTALVEKEKTKAIKVKSSVSQDSEDDEDDDKSKKKEKVVKEKKVKEKKKKKNDDDDMPEVESSVEKTTDLASEDIIL